MERRTFHLFFILIGCLATNVLAVPEFRGPLTRKFYPNEEIPIDTVLTTIGAADPAGGSFTFEISPSTYFTIDASSGLVTVASRLDREGLTNGQTEFTVVLVDSGGTQAPTSVVATVILNDINDNPPTWDNDPGAPVEISEDTDIGHFVFLFQVSDADLANNGYIQFQILSPTDGAFVVNPFGGVQVGRPLDFHITPNYVIDVAAKDSGSPSMSRIFRLLVNIQDALNAPPLFSQTVYNVDQLEGDYSSSAEILTTVVATGTPIAGTTVRYMLQSTGVTGFTVDPQSGAVLFTGILDREESIAYYLRVSAFEVRSSDTTPISQSAFTLVIVTVTDVNDNSPIFFTDHYYGSVLESSPIGHIAVQGITALDYDEGNNAVFLFSIMETVPFAIDPNTAVITVNGPLDYETTIFYSLTILAIDVNAPSLRGMANVLVDILNVNDNSPMFSATTYEFEVEEGATAGALTSTVPAAITMITATDGDDGVFGEVTYSLTGFGAERFSISTTAVFSTVVPLDREGANNRELYYLTLTATDGGGFTQSTFLEVRVLDINDNAPVFNPTSFTTILLEGTDYTSVVVLQATDADKPNTINSAILYGITNADGSDVSANFLIDSTSGTVRALNLDCETIASFALRVTATDGGTNPGPLTATATISVTIQCINEGAPIFDSPSYSVTISESLTPPSAIGITVSATDSDGHEIRYSLPSSNPDSAYFHVDEISGVMSLALAVDADSPNSHSSFTIPVLARDIAENTMTGTGMVTVNVDNVNDNAPIISNPPGRDPTSFSIIEGAGTVPNTLLTVEASDLDGDVITYAATSSPVNAFVIDSITGVLRQMSPLDRESNPTETVVITACDPGGMCDSVTVVITVTDFNDNSPVFVALTLTSTISECDALEHSPVGTVSATDVDLGANADVEFSILSGDTSRFTVGATSGIVRLRGTSWDFESGMTTFAVVIRATDNPQGTPQLSSASDATLTLTITDCNDNPPMFSTDEYTFTVLEGSTSAMNPVFSGITVTDQDSTAAFQMKSFEIIGGIASANNWFTIDSSSGVINIVSSVTIDRESVLISSNAMGAGQISFDIRVTNADSSATFTATSTVTVLISDINDNNPVIDQSDPINVGVVEHGLSGSIITIISATDQDSGTNAHIAYSITGGNSASNFAIGPETGYLTVLGDLDREGVNMFVLTVQATNDLAAGGTPDTVTVNIEVIGSNDFNPEFAQIQYTATVVEYDVLLGVASVSPGDTVQTVHATDADGMTTLAGQLEYRIASGNFLRTDKIFDIPIPSQGAVVILRPDLIDYETQNEFNMVIVANDLVSPQSQRRQNTTHLVVTIQDLNDNNPAFTATGYMGTVSEEQAMGTSVLVDPSIRATDLDINGNDPLTYSLVSSHPFIISTDGMVISTTGRIDREMVPSYMVTVVVQDSVGHSSSSQLLITVLDINDNAPLFLRTPADLQINIPENTAIFSSSNSFIQEVMAVDDDIDNNAQITYLLSGDQGNFDITIRSGQVQVIAPLDRDLIAASYALNVTATDGLLSSSIVFLVIIDNVNDNNPVFTQPVWEGSVPEDALVGTTLSLLSSLSTDLQVIAEDLDPGSNVTYFIPTSMGTAVPFDVTSVGYIVTTGLLDREVQERYSFAVSATDGFLESLENTLIEVMVTDVNDKAPVFDQPSYTAEVYELTPTSAIFLIVRAEDADEGINSEITYSITQAVPMQSTGLFAIDGDSGAIFPTQDVTIGSGDPTTIILTVTATDRGPFPMSTSASVELNLRDRNLNAPVFSEILYSFSVFENGVDQLVGSPRAMDSSGDLDSVITYNILGNSDGFQNFYIDNETGDLFTALALDRESRNIFSLTITAVDSAVIPRTGFATVSVMVNDENDNRPYFDPDVYPLAISESISINSTVIRVFGFDDDSGSNADISYRIVLGDTGVFEIDSLGVIRTVVELDREMESNYILIIEARDNGSPQNSAQTNVSILLNDVNDNSPTFTRGAVLSTDPIMIPENSDSGILLTTIEATDPDFQLNGIVSYFFQNLTVSRGPFLINPNSGEITLRSGIDGELDREKVSSYEVTVFAADLRGLGQGVRSTTGTFIVEVLDINDNIPIFVIPLYEFIVPEDNALAIPFGQVQATDADIGTNAELFYHILGNDLTNTSCSNQFCININTGELFLVEPLDRETESFHLLTIIVNNEMVLAFNETTGTPIDASTASVSITVADTNDLSPIFVASSLFAAVTEEAPFGTTITTLQANDPDTLNGSIVWFEITTPQVPYLVDRDTGVVTTAGVFTGLSGTKNEIMIRAYDNFGQVPTFTTNAILSVQVFKLTEQVILSFGRDKEVIQAKEDQIKSALVEITQARIIITQIRVRQTEAGEVDITGTDVIFFALDPFNGNVLNPALILRLIDQSGTVEDVFRECELTSIRIHPPLQVNIENEVPIWVWVVLGVLILAVVFMCCCFLIGCVVERRRSRRWKKKASTGRHQSQMEQFSHMTDYNTMANPLWVSPYEGWDEHASSTVSSGSTTDRSNPLYESQELTIEMFQDDGEDTAASRENLVKVKAPPLTKPAPVHRRDGSYDSQELVIQDETDTESDVQLLRTSTPYGPPGKKGKQKPKHNEKPVKVKVPSISVPAPVHRSDGLYDSQEIEIHMYDDLEEPDGISDTQLLRTPVPYGLAGKRGRGKLRQDDKLLATAVGYESDDSRTYI